MNQAPDPSDLDYLAHLARDSARFVEVLRRTPPETRVPTCPDWDADDLLWHLSKVHWFWGTIAGRALTTHADIEALDNGGRPSDHDGLLALFAQASSPGHAGMDLVRRTERGIHPAPPGPRGPHPPDRRRAHGPRSHPDGA